MSHVFNFHSTNIFNFCLYHCRTFSIFIPPTFLTFVYIIVPCFQFSRNVRSSFFNCYDTNCCYISLEPSRAWLYGSWIYNYLCNQCLSPPMLWVWMLIRARCTTLCDKVCQWLATCWWFSLGPPVSSTNKTDRHNITEISLKVELNTIKQTNNIPLEVDNMHIFYLLVYSMSVLLHMLRYCLDR